ncbi:hypothetical protein FPRO04_14464 [Fusarium proliferatum]|nr:hypothetical protein FPRO04_14464 [Fusarium proliferatum]
MTVELTLAIVATLDLCLKYGKEIKKLCSAIRHAGDEFEERILRVENAWLRCSEQLNFFRRIQTKMDEDHQELHWRTLLVLQEKLLTVKNILSRCSTPGEPTTHGHPEGIIARPWKYGFKKKSIDEAIRDLEIWQKQADASWFLILRMADRQLDLELRDGHSGVAVSIPSTLAIRASHQEPSSEAPSLTLPSDFPGMITCVIPFSHLKLVKQADPSLDQSGVYVLNILDPYEPSHYQIAKKNVRDLARRLQHDEPKTFGLLQCKGFFSEKTEAHGVKHITFTVIFRVPQQLSTPRSLRDVLLNDPPGSLSRRFDMARDLVKSINYVHTFGFVHKNVHPGAFLAFQSSEDASLSVFLAGFDSFRKEDGRTRRLGDDSVEKGLYRHPSRQGLNPEAEYIMQHDIYSLGVCLLEIGLWRSFISYDSKGEKPMLSDAFDLPTELSQQETLRFVRTSAAGHLLLLAREKLSSCMGDKYADVVQTCLTCLDPDNNDFGDQSEFEDEDGIQVGVRYIEKVLIKLNTLYV